MTTSSPNAIPELYFVKSQYSQYSLRILVSDIDPKECKDTVHPDPSLKGPVNAAASLRAAMNPILLYTFVCRSFRFPYGFLYESDAFDKIQAFFIP